MNKMIIILVLLFFVPVASANLSVHYTITTYANSDNQEHNHNSQNSYRIGWNYTEQQNNVYPELYSPTMFDWDDIGNNTPVPEVEPTKIKSDYSWMWIIFGLLLIAVIWICCGKKDIR